MKNVNDTFHVDKDLKKQTDSILGEQNVSNSVTLAAMDASEKGEALYGPYDGISDLMEELNMENRDEKDTEMMKNRARRFVWMEGDVIITGPDDTKKDSSNIEKENGCLPNQSTPKGAI